MGGASMARVHTGKSAAIMPQSWLAALERALHAALQTPEVQAAIRRVGGEPIPNSTARMLDEFMRADLAKWSAIVKTKGIKIQ